MRVASLSKPAEIDLAGIWRYIARDAPGRADRMVTRILSKADKLADNPFLGEDCSQYAPGLRRVGVKSYVIYYYPSATGIHVIRVLHGARDADAELV